MLCRPVSRFPRAADALSGQHVETKGSVARKVTRHEVHCTLVRKLTRPGRVTMTSNRTMWVWLCRLAIVLSVVVYSAVQIPTARGESVLLVVDEDDPNDFAGNDSVVERLELLGHRVTTINDDDARSADPSGPETSADRRRRAGCCGPGCPSVSFGRRTRPGCFRMQPDPCGLQPRREFVSSSRERRRRQ